MIDKKWLIASVVVSVIALGFGVVGIASGNDDSTVACSPGEWVQATVTKANGEKLTVQNRRQLPNGYSATTESGDQKVTVHDDGSVTATGSNVVVECIAPTH